MICFEILSKKVLKSLKLKRYFETKHKKHVAKILSYFFNKNQELKKIEEFEKN